MLLLSGSETGAYHAATDETDDAAEHAESDGERCAVESETEGDSFKEKDGRAQADEDE